MNHKKGLLLSTMLLSSSLIFGMKNNNNCENKKIDKFEYFKQLPKDIQKEVIKYLNFRDIKNFRLSNKLLKNLIIDEDFDERKKLANKCGLELMNAVENCSFDKVKDIINLGDANLDIKNEYGRTVLMLLSFLGNRDLVKLLIDAKANLDVKDKGGMTALMFASERGHKEMVKLLIDAKVNLDLRDIHGKTALILVCHLNHIEIAELLINAKADFSLKDIHDETALGYASYWAGLEIFNLLTNVKVNLQENCESKK